MGPASYVTYLEGSRCDLIAAIRISYAINHRGNDRLIIVRMF